VQVQIQIPQRIPREIEFALLGDGVQIRHE
jgi:hypothetical protein